jgi:hypothetical protein
MRIGAALQALNPAELAFRQPKASRLARAQADDERTMRI